MSKFQGSPREIYNSLNGKCSTTSASGGLTNGRKSLRPNYTGGTAKTFTYFNKTLGEEVTIDMSGDSPVRTTAVPKNDAVIQRARGAEESSSDYKASMTKASELAETQAKKLEAQRARSAEIRKNPYGAANTLVNDYNNAVDAISDGRMDHQTAAKRMDALERRAANLSAEMRLNGVDETADKGLFDTAASIRSGSILAGNYAERDSREEAERVAAIKADPMSNVQGLTGSYATLASLEGEERDEYLREMQETVKRVEAAELKRVSGIYATLATLTDEEEAIEYLRSVSPELAEQREELVRLTTVNRNAGRQQFLNTLPDEEKLEYLKEHDPAAAVQLAGALYKVNQGRMAALGQITFDPADYVEEKNPYEAIDKEVAAIQKEQQDLLAIMQMESTIEAFSKTPEEWKRRAEAVKAQMDATDKGWVGKRLSSEYQDLVREYNKYREYYYLTSSAETWSAMSEADKALAIEGAKELEKTVYRPQTADSVATTTELRNMDAADQRVAEIKAELTAKGYDADRILTYASQYYHAAWMQSELSKTAEWASKNWATSALATVVSYATNLMSGYGTYKAIAHVAANANTGVEDYIPVDTNDPAFFMAKTTSAIRGEVASNMEYGAYLYNTVNSGIDNLLRVLVAKGVASGHAGASANTAAYRHVISNLVSAQMSSQVFVNSFLEAKNAGRTDAEALTTSIASSAVEYLTELLPLEKIFSAPNQFSARALANAFGSEATEEAVAKLAGDIVDYAAYRSDADLSKEAQQYMNAGLSKSDAWGIVTRNYVAELIPEAFAGGLAGFGLSVGAQIGNNVAVRSEHSIETYKKATPQIVDAVLIVDPNNTQAAKVAEQIRRNGIDSVKSADIYKLVGQNPGIAQAVVDEVLLADAVENAAVKEAEEAAATQPVVDIRPNVVEAEAEAIRAETDIIQDTVNKLRQGAVTNAVYNQVYDAALANPELQAKLGVDLTSKGGLTKAQQRQAVKNALQSLAKEEAVVAASSDETATTVEAPATTATTPETEVTAEPTAEAQEAYAPKLKTTKNAVEAYKSGNMTAVRKFVSQAMNNEKIQSDLFPDGIPATNNQEKRTAILERVKAFASGEAIQVESSATTTESAEEPTVVRPARSIGDYKKILSITEYIEQDGVRNLTPKAQSEAYRQYIKEVTSEITKDEKIQFLGKEVSFDEFHRIRGEMATAASKTVPTIMVDSVEFYQRYYDQLQLTDAVERVNETLSKAGFPTRARISYDREEFPEMNGIRENAFFDRVKNEIVFNGNVVTVRDIVGRRLGHELFHPGEQADKALVEETIRAFEELHKAGKLKGIRINLDGGMDAAAKRYQALYQRHENQKAKLEKRSAETITIEDAKTELAADLFGELFHESSLAKEISGEKPHLAAKFATMLRDIRNKLGLPEKTDDIVATTVDGIVDKIATALKEKAEAGDGLKSVSNSISSTADAAGIEAIMDEESGRITFLDKDGNPVTEVTEDHIRDNSGFGMLISAAHDRGVITAREAEQQYKGVASIMNMIMKTQDPAMVWQFVGANMFSALKSNADGQYKTTIDFSTICRKTQDMITAMSRAMKEKGAGLTKNEVVALQQELHKAGSAVPCPVCYVFSRWAGIGAVLDKMAAWQDKYSGEYTAEELQKVIKELSSKYENKSAIRMNLHQYDTEYQDVEHALENLVADAKQLKKDLRAAKKSKDDSAIRKIQRDIDVNATAQQIEKDRLKDLEDLAAGEVSWLKIVRTDPEYSPVDKDVLFDLDKADEFASRWPKSWKYRTTRGPSAGKAILPYSDMVLGDIILGVKHTAADGDDTFKETSGEMTPAQKKKYDAAVERVKAQNLIGGQRLQSTSDFRYDYALDYVLAFFELQALGSRVQTYTKVIEFADMVAAIGGDVNLSVMPRNSGYEDGKLIFSSITGIDYKVASEFASKHDSAQLILVGINDEHIRLALEDSAATGGDTIGFVIPYHASGASIENFIKHLVEQLGESYVSENYTDYSKVQNDSVRKGATTDQVRRNILRTQILTGRHKVWNEDTKQNTSKVWRPAPEDLDLIYGESVDISNRSFEDLRAVEKRALAGDKEAIAEYESWSAGVLNDLFHKLWDDGKPYSGVRLNGDQAKSIMPHEYWNPNTTRANAYVNGFIFRSYCYSLGLNPRFTGKDSNSKTVSYGDFSDSAGYWKTLIDRPMYRNDGTYRDQQAIKMTSFQKEMLKPEYAAKKFGDAKIQEPSEARAVAAAEAFMQKQAEAKQRNYSVSIADDEAYLDAVNRNDMETAQRMVDEAANLAMPNSILREGDAINKGEDEEGTLVKMYHGSGANNFNVFEPRDGMLGNGVYLTSNWEEAVGYAMEKLGIEEDSDGNYGWNGERYYGIGDIGEALESAGYVRAFYANVTDKNDVAKSSVYWEDVIALVRDNTQLKSADPVTYDDNGDVIPLSERFNAESNDIRYSIEEVGGRLMPVIDTKNDTRDYKVAEKYLAALANTEKPFSQILYDALPVYIGYDLPGEYKGSKYTENMDKALRKVKMQAATNLDEMLLLAYDGEWRENKELKHRIDAKEGWYYYKTEFAVPIRDPKTRTLSHYNIYSGTLVIRNDADGKSYLYDLVDVKEKEKADAPPSSTDKSVRGKSGTKPSLEADDTTQSENVKSFSIEDDTDGETANPNAGVSFSVSDASDDTFRKDLAAIVEEAERYFTDITSTDPDKELSAEEQAAVNKLVKDLVKQASKAGKTEATRKYNAKLQERKQEYTSKLKDVKKAESMAQGREMTQQKRTLEAKAQAKYDKHEEKLATQRESFQQKAEIAKAEADAKLDSTKLGEKMGHIRDMRQQKQELRGTYESRMKAMKDEARSNLKLAVAVEKAKGEIVADNLREAVKETRETERAKANERLKRLRQINRNKAKAALRAQRSAAPKMTPKVTENADYITMREIAKPFQMSDLKNKETYTKAVQIAGEKLRWMGREAYRVFWSGAYAVENFANRQTGVRATSYATTLGSANVTVDRIFKNGLVNKQGDIIGDSLAETLLVYGVVNKKGKVNNRKINLESMAIFQDYLLHAHNMDRMSIEAKALAEVEAFIAENPVLEAMDEKEVGRIAALTDKEAIAEGEIDTRDTVRRYLELLEKLNNSKNKAVFEDSDGNVITAETSRQRVEALEAQYPWLKEKAEGLYEWWDTFMREWVVGTSLTEASYEAMREMYPHYVPTFRVVGKRGGSTGASTLFPRQVVKAAQGSTLSIIDIENSFARLVDTAVKSQRQNELFKNIIDTLVLDDGDERQFADIGYFDDSMFEDGAEAPHTAADAETEVSERIEEAQSAGLAKDKEGFKVSAWYNGELRSAYVSEDMYKGLQHLTGGNSNEIVKGIIRVGSALTKPMKTAITGINPAFAVRNISRDLPTAIINSISGVKFFKYWIQAGHDLVAAGVLNSEQLSKILAEVNFDFEKMEGSVERYQQYLNLGGGNATYYNDNAGFVKDIKGANWASRAVEKMGAFNEATETMTRYAEYLATIDKYGDSYESRLLGMRNAAEVTVDFSRHGVAGQVINAWIPYWNPAMQGIDKVVRSVIQSPEGKVWYNQALKTVGRASLTTVAVEALMLLVYAATGKRDEWEKLSDRVRDTYYCIPLRNGKFIRIPKNREWGAILGTPFMRLMDGLAGRDNPFENYVETSLVPNFLPSGITDMIIVSQANAIDTNKDFAGRTIVPTQYLEGSNEMMYDADTSYLARGLAKLLGYKLGAMQIDYIISDYFGDFGDMAIQLFSPATWQRNPDETAKAMLDIVLSPWVSDNRYSNQTVSDYYELVDNMEMLAKDATNHGTIDEYQQTPDYLSYAAVTRLYGSQISDLNKQARNMADGAEKDAIKAEIARLASEAMSLDAAIRSGDFSVYASESTLFDGETTQTLLGLYATTKTSSVFLANPERIFSSDGKEFILTDEQFDIYSENRRNIAESILPGLLKSDAFNELSEEDKLKAIGDAYNYASQLAKYNITGGEYAPAAWILSAAEYNESVGLPLDVVLTYRRLKSNIENQEGITNKKANGMVRSVFMSDDSLSATHKGALDEVLVSDVTVIPEDKTIDYTTHETFVVSQMSESAQKRWPDIKKQFKISADQYQEAYIVYNNDDLTADEKKTEIGRIIGSKQKGIVLYKALGAKLDK